MSLVALILIVTLVQLRISIFSAAATPLNLSCDSQSNSNCPLFTCLCLGAKNSLIWKLVTDDGLMLYRTYHKTSHPGRLVRYLNGRLKGSSTILDGVTSSFTFSSTFTIKVRENWTVTCSSGDGRNETIRLESKSKPI